MRIDIKLLTAAGMLAATLVGCGSSSAPSANAPAAKQVAAEHGHEGWWCSEHGVPEEVCALCSSKIAADFKAKGDWCKEHDRPESQCFICHPEKEAEFAALYEAKFGMKPPAIGTAHEGEHDDHDHDHKEKS